MVKHLIKQYIATVNHITDEHWIQYCYNYCKQQIICGTNFSQFTGFYQKMGKTFAFFCFSYIETIPAGISMSKIYMLVLLKLYKNHNDFVLPELTSVVYGIYSNYCVYMNHSQINILLELYN